MKITQCLNSNSFQSTRRFANNKDSAIYLTNLTPIKTLHLRQPNKSVLFVADFPKKSKQYKVSKTLNEPIWHCRWLFNVII